jgi:hypothetical protein
MLNSKEVEGKSAKDSENIVVNIDACEADELLKKHSEWLINNISFLSKLKEVMEAEARMTDVASLGSFFINWVDSLHSGKCKFEDLAYLAAASTGRIFNRLRSCMRYTADEYMFWEHVQSTHGSAVIRTLTGNIFSMILVVIYTGMHCCRSGSHSYSGSVRIRNLLQDSDP